MNRGLVLVFSLSAALGATNATSQGTTVPARGQLEIAHSPAACMDTEQFPLIEARASSANVARAFAGLSIRFKAEDDDGWYETSFRAAGGATFQAALLSVS